MRKPTLLGAGATLGAKALAIALLSGAVSAAPTAPNDEVDPFGKDIGSRWRLFLNGGYTVPVEIDPAPGGPIDFKPGYLIGAGVGYRLGSFSERLGFDVELEGLYTEARVDDDGLAGFGSSSAESASSAAAMVNGILDWRWSEKVSFTIGAGVGYSVNDFDTLEDLDSRFELDGGQDAAFAAQGKVGLVYELGGGFSWTLGYRYFRTEDLEAEDSDLGQTFDVTNEIHSLQLGVRYRL